MPELKARVAREALRKTESVQAIAARDELHPNQVSLWKRQAVGGPREVFSGSSGRMLAEVHEASIRELHANIGELTVEPGFFGAGSGAGSGRGSEATGCLSSRFVVEDAARVTSMVECRARGPS